MRRTAIWQVRPELNARLITLHQSAEYRSFTQIAQQLSDESGRYISRESCIGRAWRIGLRRGYRAPIVDTVTPVPPAVPTPVLPVKPEPCRHLALLDLREGDCKYPVSGVFPNVRFCGLQRLEDRPYCAKHWRLTHETPRGGWA
jgi:hypothetical protein